MPVTTRIITADRGSRRSVNATVKSPEEIQVKARSTIARDSGSMPTSRPTDAIDTRNDAIIAPQAIAPETALLRRRPAPAFTRNPRNGSSAISSNMRKRRRSNAEAAEHAEKI